jgi:hypothetical protein
MSKKKFTIFFADLKFLPLNSAKIMKTASLFVILTCLAIYSQQYHQRYYQLPLAGTPYKKALGTQQLTKDEEDKKITLGDKDIMTYSTKIDTTKEGNNAEYFTGLNVFGQDDKYELELRLDYSQLLLPGAGFDKKVTCDVKKNCNKSTKATTLKYFGADLTNAFQTGTYLNIGSPKLEDLKNIPKIQAYILDDKPVNMKRGVLGFGYSSSLNDYIKAGFEANVGDQKGPVFFSYKSKVKMEEIKPSKNDGEALVKPILESGEFSINKRFSPVGCSQSVTVNSKELQDNKLNQFSQKVTVSLSNGVEPATKLVKDSTLLINGVVVGSGQYFLLRKSADWIKSLNQAICKADTCNKKEDLSKVPDFNFTVKCNASDDRIAHMDMKIQGSDYAYFDGKQIQYLIGELPADVTETKPYDTIGLGRLFFSKYEFFTRAYSNPKPTEIKISYGFGDLEYKVDKMYWYIVTSIVSLVIILSMVVVALVGGSKEEGMDSTFETGADEKGSGSDGSDWNTGSNDEYAKV